MAGELLRAEEASATERSCDRFDDADRIAACEEARSELPPWADAPPRVAD